MIGALAVFVLFSLLAVLHDIAFFKENVLHGSTPFGLAPQQKFQVHAKVFEFFLLRILHDGARLRVLLDRETLLIPIDSFCFLDQRLNHACKGARLL